MWGCFKHMFWNVCWDTEVALLSTTDSYVLNAVYAHKELPVMPRKLSSTACILFQVYTNFINQRRLLKIKPLFTCLYKPLEIQRDFFHHLKCIYFKKKKTPTFQLGSDITHFITLKLDFFVEIVTQQTLQYDERLLDKCI